MPYPPSIGTGFTSVGDYLDANRGTIANERSAFDEGTGQQMRDAQAGADAVISADKANYTPDWTTLPGYQEARGKIQSVQNQAAALGTHGGVADYFQKNFHDSHSQGDFDAGLLGYDASGFQKAANGLSGYLDGGLAGVPAPPPPAPVADAPPAPLGQRDPTGPTPGGTGPEGGDERGEDKKKPAPWLYPPDVVTKKGTGGH